MSDISSRVTALLSELRRRHVFRVAVAYAVVGWIVIQAADIILPALQLPGWTVTLVVVLVLLGFPVALVLAWAYDITPDGVVRTETVEAGGERRAEGRRQELPDAHRLGSAPPTAHPAPTGSRAGAAGEAPQRTRLIVLPFRMLRPDPETDFLAFSLPDAITSSLSGLESLVVMSNLAALRYAGETPDLSAIAAETGVDVVLTGTVLRMGEQLRVRTQLADAHDGRLLWSQSSDVSLGDLFGLQEQLSHRIVESLELPLTARERQILRHDVPASARAYEFYLRANQIAYEVGHWSTARDLYLQSIDEDPHYAPAWARLGRCYRLLAKWSAEEDLYRANLRSAESGFQRALELNPELPIAHNLYAQLEVELGRATDAMVRLLRRAQVSGGDPEIFAGLVPVCRFCGLLEASLAAHQQARRLDPSVPTSISHTYYMLGEYERVLDHTFGDIGYIEPLALASLGRPEEAISLLRQREEAIRNVRVRPYLVSLRALLEGNRAECLAAYRQATAILRDPEALHYQVRQLARLGETEVALGDFRRVVEMGFVCYPFFERDAWLDSLRSDSRFRESMREAERQHCDATEAFRGGGGEFVLRVRAFRSAQRPPAERTGTREA